MLRTIIFKFILAIYFVVWSPILLLGLVSQSASTFFLRQCSNGVLVLARLIGGIKYELHYPTTDDSDIPMMPDGNRRLDGKAIIAAKHMSMMEVAILNKHISNPFFILKRELLWIPIYGWAFWRSGLVPVNRARGATNMIKLAERVAEKIMNGGTLIIFPEGTRAKPGDHVPVKRGLLFLAQHLKLPILPVGLDTGLYWPKKGRMHKGIAHVWFEPMLPCNADVKEISDAINRHSA